MSKKRELEIWFHRAAELLFPVILLLFPLLKINQGVDLTDTPYSLGNYRFFESSQGVWMLATFLSNVAGHFLTKLPMGGTLLGMKFYTSLLVSGMALFSYRFFKTKMPSFLAFAGEMAAIGFCWCPTGILYNYMTYLFFLVGAVLLFRGLAGSRPACLFLAGICLGLNVSVRFPNVLEASLIVAVWYYGSRKRKSFERLARETALCAGGFLAAQAAMFLVITARYGLGAYEELIDGLFGMSAGASDYTLGEMLGSILSAYGRGFEWMLYMLLCILPGIPFFMIRREKFPLVRKVVYCACIVFLFVVLGKWGMYNFRYYQKESGLQWGVIFLILSLGVCVWMIATRMLDDEWKLIGCISLVIILVTPLGSNNYVWPILNNLFFIAPVTFWMIYRFVRWGRTCVDSTGRIPFFPAKAMAAAMALAFLLQSLGLGAGYVFKDGESGETRNVRILNNRVLFGMYTTALNAETMDELSNFMAENQEGYQGKKLILYGDIPGLSYYLDRPPAIFTSWPDLDTNSLSLLREELSDLGEDMESEGADRPLVIITPYLAAYHEGNERAMEWFGVDEAACGGDEKLGAILEFMDNNHYEQAFVNEAYAVYE